MRKGKSFQSHQLAWILVFVFLKLGCGLRDERIGWAMTNRGSYAKHSPPFAMARAVQECAKSQSWDGEDRPPSRAGVGFLCSSMYDGLLCMYGHDLGFSL